MRKCVVKFTSISLRTGLRVLSFSSSHSSHSIVSHYTSSPTISSIDRYAHFNSLFHTYWQSYRLPSSSDVRESGMDEMNEFNAIERDQHSLQGRDNIVKAVCPNLHGMFYVKLSLLLTLIGGSRSSDTRRSQSHLLIVGDPGWFLG
jgi:DNA replicative helicase MCM subunit Mcm2 (Cdc46/Mcm family)